MPGAVCGREGITAGSREWDMLGKLFEPPIETTPGLNSSELDLGQRVVARRGDGTFRGAIVHEFDARGHPTLLLDPSGSWKGPIRSPAKHCFAVNSVRTLEGFRVPPQKMIGQPARKHRAMNLLERINLAQKSAARVELEPAVVALMSLCVTH
jgi:hypothetical protein